MSDWSSDVALPIWFGLGAIAAHASFVTDQMISRAAHSLGGIVDVTKPGAAVLPPVSRLTEFTERIAVAVAREVVKQELNQVPIEDVKAAVRATKWVPEYADAL